MGGPDTPFKTCELYKGKFLPATDDGTYGEEEIFFKTFSSEFFFFELGEQSRNSPLFSFSSSLSLPPFPFFFPSLAPSQK